MLAHLASLPLNPYRPIIVGNQRALVAALKPRRALVHPELLDFAALLQDLNWTADCFVLDARQETPEASLGLLRFALDRMETQGEGVLIANAPLNPQLSTSPEAAHIWAQLVTCHPSPVTLLWFAKDHSAGPTLDPRLATLDPIAAAQYLAANRLRLRPGAEAADFLHAADTCNLWQVALKEWQSPARPHLSLDAAGCVQFRLSEFDRTAHRLAPATINQLELLHGQHPAQLVVMKETRTLLEQVVGLKPWPSTLDSRPSTSPALLPAVQAALADLTGARAPLYPLSPLQRLAFLDEQDTLTCCDHLYAPATLNSQLSTPLFRAGQPYALQARQVNVQRTGTKLNLLGVREAVVWDGPQTAYFLTASNGREYCFGDVSWREPNVTVWQAATRRTVDFTLAQLLHHFIVPDVPDVATVFPDQYQQNLKTLDALVALINAA